MESPFSASNGDQFRMHRARFFQRLKNRDQVTRRNAKGIQDTSQFGDSKCLLHLDQRGGLLPLLGSA